MRLEAMTLLQEEAELNEVVQLVGIDALSLGDRLKMEAARSLREDYLQQNSFHEVDTYASGKKQAGMLHMVLNFYHLALEALDKGADFSKIVALPVREAIGRAKYVSEDNVDERFAEIDQQMKDELSALV